MVIKRFIINKGKNVMLSYIDKRSFVTINSGDRIAQLVTQKVEYPFVAVVDDGTDLSATERGKGGFGSTGEN
jgi:dUTPase